jgi:hypothetical protein
MFPLPVEPAHGYTDKERYSVVLSEFPPTPPGVSPPLAGRIDMAFALGARVNVDGHADICGIVTGYAHFERGDEIQVEWFASGDRKQAWFGASRLALAKE